MSVLDLVRAVLGEVHIEVMSDVSEGLSRFAGESSESAGAFAPGEFEEFLVELVSLSSDDGEERGERDAGVPCAWSGAADGGGHEDGAGENGGGIVESFGVGTGIGLWVSAIDPGLECIEDESADYEAFVEAFGVDFVGVPFAEDVVVAFGDWVYMIMCAEVEAEFVESFEGEV
jgi:hypothetical protein